jgi:hypothetical protein
MSNMKLVNDHHIEDIFLDKSVVNLVCGIIRTSDLKTRLLPSVHVLTAHLPYKIQQYCYLV